MNFSNKNVKDEILTKRNILKYISEYDVYNYYIPGIIVGTIGSSPFRVDDIPSFGIFIGGSGELAFNDFKLGGGDFVKFVAWMEQCDYYTALHIINDIFNVGLVETKKYKRGKMTHIATITNYKPKKKRKPKISIQVRDWKDHDIEYWNPLDIKQFNDVYPIEFFWLDEQLVNCHKYTYAYRYGENIYKIYQPFLEVNKGKWWSNISADINWFGHTHLPTKADILFVASSNKDALTLNQIGFNAIAPHTEAQIFTTNQFNYYKKRFKKIIVFYDNDETGILKAEKFTTAFNLTYIMLEEEDTKDPFEYVQKYDLNNLKDFIDERIY